MKRIVAFLSIIVLSLSLFACGLNGNRSQSLQVGYGKAEIMPEESVPLGGYGNTSNRMSTGYLSMIYATCVAFTDADNNTVLLFSADLVNTADKAAAYCRTEVSKATGIPVENIMFAATHMHSGPDLENVNEPSVARFRSYLAEQMSAAAKAALADRAVAKMQTATVQTRGLNFVRRYILEDGSAAGDNYGNFNQSPIENHESVADSALQLIKFVREGKKEIIMANFQVHPHRAGGSRVFDITADIVGAFREEMEAKLGCNFIYFTGASGNINPTSRIGGETATDDYEKQGIALANYAIGAEGSYTEQKTGKVKLLQSNYQGQVDHSQDYKVAVARSVSAVWKSTGDRAQAMKVAKDAECDISSPYAANGIVIKAALGPTMTLELYALSIGDVAFVFAPYEMFDTNGMEIKQGSPFKMTFVSTMANGYSGYIPSALAWKNGGYSIDVTRFVEGTAEDLSAHFVSLLNQLHGA